MFAMPPCLLLPVRFLVPAVLIPAALANSPEPAESGSGFCSISGIAFDGCFGRVRKDLGALLKSFHRTGTEAIESASAHDLTICQIDPGRPQS